MNYYKYLIDNLFFCPAWNFCISVETIAALYSPLPLEGCKYKVYGYLSREWSLSARGICFTVDLRDCLNLIAFYKQGVLKTFSHFNPHVSFNI